MIRGTTPTILFNLPILKEEIDVLFLTISQSGIEKITKDLSDVQYKDETFYITLTQEETISLSPRPNVNAQIRLKTIRGDVMASNIETVNVSDILREGVI